MDKYRLKRWIKNKANFLKAVVLLGGKCKQCGETDVSTLDFHHTKDKDENLARLLRTDNWSKIELELDKCELYCSNCHRKKHFNKKLYKKHENEIVNRSQGWRPPGEAVLKKWSKEEVALLIDLYNDNQPVDEMVRKTARNWTVIKRKLQDLIDQNILKKRTGKTKRRNPRSITEKERNMVVELWNAGNSASKIASIMDLSLSPIYKIIRKLIREKKGEF